MQPEIRASVTLSSAPRVPRENWPWDLEGQLVDEAKRGSADAFERLVARYRARIFRIAHKITRHYHDAEDVMQSALLKAFNKLPAFRGESSFYTWLVSITVNEALMKMRRRRPTDQLIEEWTEIGDKLVAREIIHSPGPNPEQSCSQAELRHILAAAIGKLKPEHRMVFQLRAVEGLSNHEVAEALSLTIPAVKTRLYRARMRLQRSLYRLSRPKNGAVAFAWQQPDLSTEIRAVFGPLR